SEREADRDPLGLSARKTPAAGVRMPDRPSPVEVLKRFFHFLPHRQTAVADLLGKGATDTHLDLICRSFKVPDRCLNALQYLTDCLLEDQAIQRYDRHHRIIRVQPNPVLDGYLGRKSSQIDCCF